MAVGRGSPIAYVGAASLGGSHPALLFAELFTLQAQSLKRSSLRWPAPRPECITLTSWADTEMQQGIQCA